MDHNQRLHLAKLAYDKRNAARKYVVTWYGGGSASEYQGEAGLKQLAAMLRITPHSLKCYLSRGKGRHIFRGTNPTLGIEDIGFVTRCEPLAKEVRPRGRPRKHFPAKATGAVFDPRDWQPHSASNKIPVPPGSTPKTRNRRTDESQEDDV